MSRQPLCVSLCCVFLTCFATPIAYPTVLAEMSGRELAMEADAVVMGTVVAIQPHPPDGSPDLWTDIDIVVREPLKHARLGELIRLTLPGGVQGQIRQIVDGVPTFSLGENVLVHVRQHPSGHLGVVGWAQGKNSLYRGNVVTSYRPIDEVVGEIASVVGPAPSVTLPPAPLPVLPRFGGYLEYPPQPGDTPVSVPVVPARNWEIDRYAQDSESGTVMVPVFSENFDGGWPGGWEFTRMTLVDVTWGPVTSEHTRGRSAYSCKGGTDGMDPPKEPAKYWSYMRHKVDLSDTEEVLIKASCWKPPEGTDTKADILMSETGADNSFHAVGSLDYQHPGNWKNYSFTLTKDRYGRYFTKDSWIRFRAQRLALVPGPSGLYLDDIRVSKRITGSRPRITSIAPSEGRANAGQVVTILGRNFTWKRGRVLFPWNGTQKAAPILAWADDRIRCRVPRAESGGVVVESRIGAAGTPVASAPVQFDVTFCASGHTVNDRDMPETRYYCRVQGQEPAAIDRAFDMWMKVAGCYPHNVWGGTYLFGHLPGKADFTNVVGFRTSWPYDPAVPSVTMRRGVGIGGVLEHDIALNAQDFRWSTRGAAGSHDVQDIVTHEVGHWWGLLAIYGDRDNRKTMYGKRRPGQTFRRSLEPEDREGIRWLYPGKPELFTLPRSLKFHYEEDQPAPAHQTLKIKNMGGGSLSWRATTDTPSLQPWIEAAPLTGNPSKGMEMRVGLMNLAWLRAESSPYKGLIEITGPPGSGFSPLPVPVTLHVTTKRPNLVWAGTKGFEQDGIKPESGVPDATDFVYKVLVRDPDNDVPDSVRVQVRRNGALWGAHNMQPVRPGSNLYRISTPLPLGRYNYRFRATDDDGNAYGDPCDWQPGPNIISRPKLRWAGGTGYRSDGCEPENGLANDTRFRFRVRYRDLDDEMPTYVRVRIIRNGTFYARADMAPVDADPDPETGIIYRHLTRLPAGTYAYTFGAADVDGTAVGPATARSPGPTVTDGGAGVMLTGLLAQPTAAGAQITFRLSSAASVDGRILNVAGRPVKRLCAAKPVEAGLATLLWNGHGESGLPVPSGNYLVEVRAAKEDGTQARALTQLRIER